VILSAVAVAILAPSHTATTQSNGLASGTAGMMAYVDPETGELTTGIAPASAVQLDPDTQNALRRDTEGLEVVRHADGSESIDLQGRFQSVSVVRIDENGKAIVCTDNAASVERVLTEKTSTPATPEVK
jgi:hypothetical protein